MNQDKTTHDQDALNDQVLGNPYDLEARRVYADILAERGNPRGEFILRQFEMEESDPWSPAFIDAKVASEDLFQRHASEWDLGFRAALKQLYPRTDKDFYVEDKSIEISPSVGFQYRYGFVDSFEFKRFSIIGEFESLRHLAPIRNLKLEVISGDTQPSQFKSVFASFRHFDVSLVRAHSDVPGSEAATVRDVVDAMDLPELETLKLLCPKHADECLIPALKRTPFANLKSLDLAFNQMTSPAFKRLERTGCFQNLEHLRLTDNAISDSGAKILAQSGCFATLRSLNIKMTNITNPGLRHIAKQKTPHLTKFAVGWWFGKNPTEKGIRYLLEAGCLSNLKELDLTGWEMPKAVVQLIAFAEELSNLKVLRLGNTRIDDNSAEILASSPTLNQLDLLDLSATKISPTGLQMLLKSGVATGLTSLNLSEVTSMKETDMKGILDLPTLESLRYLDLSRTSLSKAGLKTICQSDALSDLQVLDITENELPKKDCLPLWNQNKLESLGQIRLNLDGLSAARIDALKEIYGGVFGVRGHLDC